MRATALAAALTTIGLMTWATRQSSGTLHSRTTARRYLRSFGSKGSSYES